jgi:hypothetical protein
MEHESTGNERLRENAKCCAEVPGAISIDFTAKFVGA